jgi:acyl carrier protein/NAD(P)-dependent dehydrogenase (short-subunit alcohol dehydrogenase family)
MTPEPSTRSTTHHAHAQAPATNGDQAPHVGQNGTSSDHSHSQSPAHTNGTHVPAPVPLPAPAPAPPPLVPNLSSSDPARLALALQTVQENLAALQKLGEQTAQLHRQFLDGQDRTQRTFQTLLEQQQRLTLVSLGLEAPPSPLPAPIPNSSSRVHSFPARETIAEPASSRFSPPPAPPEPEILPSRTIPEPIAPSPSASNESVHAVLVEIVAEKTGYPAEMLEPHMLLDADLGIDSIKRVEILSALQERLPEAPVIKPEHLGTLRTLRQIAEFLSPGIVGSAHPTEAVDVSAILREIVAEKTGYPAEMLEPDMLLDADLGIDSIKRVEILSALQERLPKAPVIKPEHLGTLRTLRQIAEFLSRVGTAHHPEETTESVDVSAILVEIVAEKTGYPAEMLEPDMLLDADLGIDSIKRVEILSALQERLPEAPVIKPEHLGTLRTLRQIADFLGSGLVEGTHPAATAEKVGGAHPAEADPPPDHEPAVPLTVQRLIPRSVILDALESRDPVTIRAGGEIWIAEDGSDLPRALAGRLESLGYRVRRIGRGEVVSAEPTVRLDGLVLLTPASGAVDTAIKDAFRLLRTAGPGLRQAGKETGAVLATISRLDGSFGLRGLSPQTEPTSGGLAGLAKTAGQEWPEVHCKAIDLDPTLEAEGPDRAAEAIVEEIFRRGPTEVGVSVAGRSRLELSPIAFNGDGRIAPLRTGDLVVITGGARGITAEVAIALAEAFRPTLLILGRSPEPTREPDWLAPLTGEAEIKRALLTRAGGQATPRAIAEQFHQVSANREVLRNLERIEAAGARVVYRSVDVRDAEAVGRQLDQARAGFGPIRGLIHGAGVLADRRIEEKNDEQFAAVYDTKVAGLRALLQAVALDELRLLVLFSSSTARFGRKGQVAYAAANEVLNKWAQREARRRPACRVVSVNWGPWDGGMVTSSLKPIFEAEGVPLIPPRDGARYLVEEIQTAAEHRPVEVVVLGGTSRAEPEHELEPKPAPPSALTTIFELTLDLARFPVLRSHVMDGRPVVPMALILEWLAHGALHRNPGLHFVGIDEFRILKGVVLRDGRPETVRVLAGKAARAEGLYRVPVELCGSLGNGREVTHARGEVVLADRLAPAQPAIDLEGLLPYPAEPGEFYREVLFHGPDLHGIDRVEGSSASGIAGIAATAPPPSSWTANPPRSAWLADPLALDAAFQLMILWGVDQFGKGSLPTYLGRYRQFRRAFPAGPVRIAARVTQAREHRALADIEFLDLDGQLVARIEDYECVIDASLNQAFRRNRLVQFAHGSGSV